MPTAKSFNAASPASDDEEPPEDTTAAIPLHSKKTERLQRKLAKRDQKRKAAASLSRLPTELILDILKLLPPSDIYSCSSVDRRFHALVEANANNVADDIIRRRYAILVKCFPRPCLLSSVDAAIQPLLTDPSRQEKLSLHKKPYQHVQPPDHFLVCTCVTCILLWNNLGLVLDFAHWQDHLDSGTPIPILPRGHKVDWNEALVARNARIVRSSLTSTLSYARILETHLHSTIRAIRRHGKNRGNKRKHVDMTNEDAALGNDQFLQKAGPLSLEFPFNRDEYHMLEAYLPNRWWRKNEQHWVYYIAGYHEKDLEYIVRMSNR
ncbi:hypothetical protein BDV96DRAFT_614001 [Lophiotrema nucula]|uniref:F-box domain-containing protein n=1 Tax=Lophiotrema nucula TaxID=690887 RepID=A0A6A5Z1Z4_9PLEO|nr:hypothetical protein BDV96DRAFT_614001 [Lophiotrema nucula]